MPATKYDFNIEQGSSFELIITYKTSSDQIVDLTGWCARLTWRSNKRELSSYVTDNTDLQSYNFYIIEAEGRLVFQLPASVTNNFNFQSAKYDLELQAPTNIYTDGGKKVERILYGTINIIPRFSQNPNLTVC
jgi:hypothetical protein